MSCTHSLHILSRWPITPDVIIPNEIMPNLIMPNIIWIWERIKSLISRMKSNKFIHNVQIYRYNNNNKSLWLIRNLRNTRVKILNQTVSSKPPKPKNPPHQWRIRSLRANQLYTHYAMLSVPTILYCDEHSRHLQLKL